MRTGNSSTSFRQRPEKISRIYGPEILIIARTFIPQKFAAQNCSVYHPEIISQNCAVIAQNCRVIAQIFIPQNCTVIPQKFIAQTFIAQKYVAQNCTVIAQKFIAQNCAVIAHNCTVISQKFIASPRNLSHRNLSPRIVQFIAQKFIAMYRPEIAVCIAQKLLFNFETNRNTICFKIE